jgi:hypothetical protein
MNIERIKQMVEADLKIDGTELGDESIRTPQLHGKYLNIYHDESLILKIHKRKCSVHAQTTKSIAEKVKIDESVSRFLLNICFI